MLFGIRPFATSLEFDLITTCNAVCPTCLRYEVQDGKLHRNPLVDYNVGLDLNIIEDIARSKILNDQAQIDFVGLLGDAVAHPKFLDIIDTILEHKPDICFNIHTNGGLKTTTFFEQLGNRLNKPSDIVYFSIDGLEDTNHLYRKNVVFSKAIDNMKAFISGGGNAVWQYVEFPWNKHQIQQARKLADELGCKKFIVRENAQELDRLEKATDAANKEFTNKPGKLYEFSDSSPYNMSHDHKAQFDIEDECISDQKIYINNTGDVVPCCFINGLKFEHESVNDYYDFMDNKDNWNNLNHNSFDDIMSNSWWNKLAYDLKTNPHGACVRKCGVKK